MGAREKQKKERAGAQRKGRSDIGAMVFSDTCCVCFGITRKIEVLIDNGCSASVTGGYSKTVLITRTRAPMVVCAHCVE